MCRNAHRQFPTTPEREFGRRGIYFYILIRGMPIQSSRFKSPCSGINGDREIADSGPLPTIFTILTHCLNATSITNYYYSTRANGRWFCLDGTLIGPGPLAPLDDFSQYKDGHYPRLAAEVVPKTFYRSLFALALAALRFGSMSWARRNVSRNCPPRQSVDRNL